MAYREVGTMDIDQVVRRWMAGEKIRAIARLTGLDRNTIRRIVRSAEESGVRRDAPLPDARKLQAIRQRIGRPGVTVATGEAEQRLKTRTEQIRAWLEKDHLLLSKVHELLGREGLAVSYSSLYRFARKWCDFGTASAISVRRAESPPGEMAEVDFGRLGLLQELGSRQPRIVQGFILTLGYSRLSCVIPVFKQDLPTVIDCFERTWEFFGGCPRRVVLDGMKACIDQADPYTPRFNRTFLEYANYRGFLPDPARPRHPQDKPVVENSVAYIRERFFKGETFIDLDDVARRGVVSRSRRPSHPRNHPTRSPGGLRGGGKVPVASAARRTLRSADLGAMQSTSGSPCTLCSSTIFGSHPLDRLPGRCPRRSIDGAHLCTRRVDQNP